MCKKVIEQFHMCSTCVHDVYAHQPELAKPLNVDTTILNAMSSLFEQALYLLCSLRYGGLGGHCRTYMRRALSPLSKQKNIHATDDDCKTGKSSNVTTSRLLMANCLPIGCLLVCLIYYDLSPAAVYDSPRGAEPTTTGHSFFGQQPLVRSLRGVASTKTARHHANVPPSCIDFSVFVIGMDEAETRAQQKEVFKYPCSYFVPAFSKKVIAKNLGAFLYSGIVAEDTYHTMSFDKSMNQSDGEVYQASVDAVGLSGRALQDEFTIACGLSHRRAQELMLAMNVKIALILESDSVFDTSIYGFLGMGSVAASHALADNATLLTPTWELINLGRCWDFCPLDVPQASVLNSTGSLVRSPSTLCTNALLVTKKGAKKFLSLTTPHVLSIDQAIALFGRTHAMEVLSLTPRMWKQVEIDASAAEGSVHDSESKPECDPGWKWHHKSFFDGEEWIQDRITLAKGTDHWSRVSHGPLGRECGEVFPGAVIAPLTPAANNKEKLGCNYTTLRSRCEYRGGGKASSSSGGRFRAEKDLLKAMQTLGLRGFVVWDIWDASEHTHANLHQAIFNTFLDVASQALEPMHVCWLRIDEFHKTCSLNVALGVDGGGGLANSLVMATPKHMVFTSDPTFVLMPRDPSSRYVFHDIVPARFQEMKESGHAVEWIVRGPDGNIPLEDATYFVRDQLAKPELSCPVERLSCSFPETKSFVGPWATSMTPVRVCMTYVVCVVC
jgi:hypothetical protein